MKRRVWAPEPAWTTCKGAKFLAHALGYQNRIVQPEHQEALRTSTEVLIWSSLNQSHVQHVPAKQNSFVLFNFTLRLLYSRGKNALYSLPTKLGGKQIGRGCGRGEEEWRSIPPVNEPCSCRLQCASTPAINGDVHQTGHEGPEVEYKHSSTLSLTSLLDRGCVQRHAPTAFYPQGRPGTHCIGGWVDPRAGLDGCGKSCPYRDSISGTSSP